jgi:O-methyltransferase involved in polyketide biosynthesis
VTTALTTTAERDTSRDGNLLITALYTAGAWSWAGLPGAELFDHKESRRVFNATNAVLRLGWLFGRPASLRHGLVQRHTMIDRALDDALAGGVRHVLELAAGLSRRGAHYGGQDGVRYTEVDLPPVVAKKRALLAASAAGRAVLARDRHRLVEGDLATLDLATLDAAPAGAPLAVVSEGLLMYLDGDAQRALFRRVRGLLDDGGVYLFDLVPVPEKPPRFWLGRAIGWFMRRATRGSTFVRDERTRADVVADLVAAGFEVAVLEPAAAPGRWRVPHLERATEQLVFCAWVPSGGRTLVATDVAAASRPTPPGRRALPRSPS